MPTHSFSITGNLVDIPKKEIYPAEVVVTDGKITSVNRLPLTVDSETPSVNGERVTVNGFILPGFIDSHVHIESSMLVPTEFAKIAVVHGTVGTISDPHEIANVCGMEGVEFMIENGKQVNFKFNFGAPSCVPATIFETAGAALDSAQVRQLLGKPEIKYLSEMMNFPGVLFKDEEVMKKIAAAHELGKPVDGHAPGLMGETAKQYIDAGISTDHECFTAEEALDKLGYGMKILIREGSAAKNFEALIGLMHDYSDNMMFCSDDKHPDSLVEGHLNQICARAVAKGIDVFKVLQAACINPVEHYKLDVGLLKEGDYADFIVADDLVNFNISKTYINGELVAADGKSFITTLPCTPINKFECDLITADQLALAVEAYPSEDGKIPVIEALEGQLITNKLLLAPTIVDGKMVSNVEDDILKMVVVNRYHNAPIATAFIKNFNLKKGALASSVAHDSHNIVAVGVDDESLAAAINMVIKEKGGVSAVDASKELVLGLPVAGLMSADDGYKVAETYTAIDKFVKETLGSTLAAPFMTLSFMALLVIPHLKLSDKGLFDGDKFAFL
ncbi:adenine deaminase [Parasediminibacterium sp. JCM 36343]|uniref:adenine deaminase n=1 Tax=Parasediminibacterium sp. JCM 36343 TaxID=3374279 RepID=UPI00397CD1EF